MYKVVICGDLNAEFDVTTNKQTVEYFLNTIWQFSIFCVNDKPTRGASCLANIMTNIEQHNHKCEVLTPDLSDHEALLFKVLLDNSDSDLPIKYSIRPKSKNQIVHFKKILSEENWFPMMRLHNSSASGCFENFFNRFLTLFELCFPVKSFHKNKSNSTRGKKVTNNWYLPKLARMKSFILICKDIYCKEPCEQRGKVLKTLRCQYRSALKEAKRQKNGDIIEQSSNKCKTAWTIINRASGRSTRATAHPVP